MEKSLQRHLASRLPYNSTSEPLVQPHEAVAAGVARFVVGAGDVAVEGHRHVEH